MAEPSADLARAWHRALAVLKKQVSGPAFDLWIGDVTPVGYRNGVVELGVPNAYVQELMAQRYREPVRLALVDAIGEPLDVSFQLQSERRAPAPVAPSPAAVVLHDDEAPHDIPFASTPLNPRFTFDTFVVGSSNRFPHAAALAVARNPGKNYNPFFVYGGVGLGKTHLTQAIGHRVRELNPAARVVYVSGETFLYHYVSSIREDRTAEFRRRYRNVDLWLVDDFQFVASRERTRTEAEFFHTFNALYETGKQIVITSDRPPKDLLIDDRLRSRFEWGLVTDIKPPDTETRLAILQKRAEEDRLLVPENVLMYIAQVVRESIRVLEGALVKVVASASLLHETVTLELARDCLKDYSTGDRPLDISAEAITQAVARHFAVEAEALGGKSRRQEVVLARQVAMYLCRELLKQSYADIGVEFSRDHSTVIHACTKIADLLVASDPDVAGAVETITQKVELHQLD